MFVCYSFSEVNSSLIKRGRGTGPDETRQPAEQAMVPIPAGFFLTDEELLSLVSSFEEIFYIF
jgi:hypothetical protein